jgi:hypothetical protein
MSGGDGMGYSTQVPVVNHVWAPMAMSYCARHLMSPFSMAKALTVPTWYRKPSGEGAGSPRASRSEGRIWSRLTGGEILSAHEYRGSVLVWIAPGFSCF